MSGALELPPNLLPNGISWAELVDQLKVPAERIQRSPLPGTANEEDFLYANERLGIRCELIDGTLVELPMGNYESLLAIQLASLLLEFVCPRKLGIVIGADSMFRLFGGNIRMPDVAYIPKDRFPNGLPQGPVWSLAPALAVEVISASNTRAELARKRSDSFAPGVSVIWVVDPIPRTVTVYDDSDPTNGKQAIDRLDGGTVLSGFSIALSDLFSVMDL